jgi:hypothetical protein
VHGTAVDTSTIGARQISVVRADLRWTKSTPPNLFLCGNDEIFAVFADQSCGHMPMTRQDGLRGRSAQSTSTTLTSRAICLVFPTAFLPIWLADFFALDHFDC